MTRRDLLLLFLFGLAVPLAIAQFQSLPGYMDADYYFGGGIQLAKGNGFTEPYIWNYLSDPPDLPQPSHAYWMPLASIVAAAGMWLTGQTTFAAARIGFILLAALVPPLTSLLAFRLTSNRAISLLSGLLACFPVYYAPFLPVTDNYAIYMLLGISFFLLLSSLLSSDRGLQSAAMQTESLHSNYQLPITFFLLGLTSALMTLARSDGLLWLGMSLLVAVWHANAQVHRYTGTQVSTDSNFQGGLSSPRPLSSNFYLLSAITQYALRNIFLVTFAFLLVISPWYLRNLNLFGSLMAPGGSRALWLTNYNDTFAYPASQLTFESWLASGWDAILTARFTALQFNLLNAFAAQGGIFLFPFILVGLWQLRKDVRVRFAALAWVLLLATMTIAFPFAGPRGAFFHAGAALQPIWWAVAPIGLDAVVGSIRRRGWLDDHAFVIFRGALVGIAVLMTVVIFFIRVPSDWEREDGIYQGLKELLVQAGAPTDAIVVVRNPPGFYIVTDYRAIAVPNGGINVILEVARRYNAQYYVDEPTRENNVNYDSALNQFPFRYLGESNGNRLYEILR